MCDLVTIHFEYGINGLGTVSSRFIQLVLQKKRDKNHAVWLYNLKNKILEIGVVLGFLIFLLLNNIASGGSYIVFAYLVKRQALNILTVWLYL